MANPVILVVDDDQGVLSAVERDLRPKFGHDYRIVKAASGAAALDLVAKLQQRNEAIALFLTDQRMPNMTGLEFLEQAIQAFPEAKRVLLTAYADTEAAIASINKLQLDYYLLKPWDPPEDHLYPVLTDLLDDWRSNVRLPFEGIRVAGTLWSPGSHDVKDFLARHQIAYQWLDVDADEKARALVETSADGSLKLPVLFFPDGSTLVAPEIHALAEKLGIQTTASMPFYDVVIIGAGPAGLSAAVYGASSGLQCLVIEKQVPGGQAGNSPRIENYLGFPTGIAGMDLTRRAVTQARRFGAEIISTQCVTGIRTQDMYRVITLDNGMEIVSKAVLLATGAAFRKLEVPGIDQFLGAGVFYGAAYTEAAYYKDEPVFVVGGANSAGQGALFLSRFASKVTMLIRREVQQSSHYLREAEAANPKIERRFNVEIVEIHGKPGRLDDIVIQDIVTGEKTTLPGAAMFVFIGAIPQNDIVKELVLLDPKGFVLTGHDLMKDGKPPREWPLERDPFMLETSVPGIFAAGDVRLGTNHRVASATGEGGIAIAAIESYLKTL
ncbi:MAG TPA: FAD-dependent oxidoreductase [Anaerolineales bacterium]|nr:FAD-dependent oxidoreductase [Anaerolineales bacterium]